MASGEDTTRRYLIIGISIIAGGVLLVGGVLMLGGGKEESLVILKAENSPIKIAPSDPGGLKLNSIDSPVMSFLDQEKNNEGEEVLLPPVTEPELPPIEVTEDAEPKAEPAQADSEEVAATPEPAETNSVSAAQPVEEAPDVKEEVAETNATPEASAETSTAPEATPETEAENIDSADEITAAINDLPVKKPTPKIVATTDINSPSFVVQFAAFKNEGRAKNTAAVLSTKHESRLSGVTLGYMKRGDYWRVVTEPMPRADATSLCSMFRSVGQDCITKLMELP